MTELSTRLNDIQLKLKERTRLENLLNQISLQMGNLESKRAYLLDELHREELDVEKLQGISFAHLIHLIKGDSTKLLEREKREVISAKLKYDEACLEISNLSNEVKNIRKQIAELGDLDAEYSKLLKEKENFIKSNNPKLQRDIENTDTKIIELRHQEVEIDEALAAGNSLRSSLSCAVDSLDSAHNWGVYDMFGGGILATSIKHSRIDDAKQCIEESQSLLRRFHRELQDVNYSEDINIDIGSFLTFADYFFDGLFVDWSVQSKIDDSLDRVHETIRTVEGIIKKLERDKVSIKTSIAALEKQKTELIEKS